MNFIQAAIELRDSLREYSPDRYVMDYLLNNAIGRDNAKPWPIIQRFLQGRGLSMSKGQFQQRLLKISRQGGAFIASNDHGKSRGYFLIADKEDAAVMINWYQHRIAAETANLNKLQSLVFTP